MLLELAMTVSFGKAFITVFIPADLAHHRSLGLAAHETMFFSTLELLLVLVGTPPVVFINGILIVALLEALVAVE